MAGTAPDSSPLSRVLAHASAGEQAQARDHPKGDANPAHPRAAMHRETVETRGVARCIAHAFFYQTSQRLAGRIALPSAHPKAVWNSGRFCRGPMTRKRAGLCGSLATCMRWYSGEATVHQFCA